jgi:AraC-like DNA-binding protein
MKTRLSEAGFDFCTFLDFNSSNDFFLFEIGTYKCPPGYGYGPSIRSCDIIHYVRSGRGHLVLDGREYDIGPNQAFLIPANVIAYYEADEADPWSYLWLHTGGPRFQEVLYLTGLGTNQPIFTPTGDPQEFERIFEEIAGHQTQEYYCIGKMYELYDYMISHSQTKVERNTNMQLEYVREAIKIIQCKYPEPIKISDIASVCGLDRSYLSRLFKDATGWSIQGYLVAYRMKMAAQLMKDSSNSIQYISLAVGYTDIFTFSKAFKKYYGVSPREYRRNRLDVTLSVTTDLRDAKTNIQTHI